MDLQAIEDDLRHAVSLFKGKLPNDQLQDMIDLTNAGEPGVAFENLCTQLYEFEVRIDNDVLDKLTKIGKSMNIADRYCERLSSLLQ